MHCLFSCECFFVVNHMKFERLHLVLFCCLDLCFLVVSICGQFQCRFVGVRESSTMFVNICLWVCSFIVLVDCGLYMFGMMHVWLHVLYLNSITLAPVFFQLCFLVCNFRFDLSVAVIVSSSYVLLCFSFGLDLCMFGFGL